MQPQTWYVTPSLFVGNPPGLPKTAKVDTVAEAVRVIKAGGIAVLPHDCWDEARQVVSHFEVDPIRVESRISFGKTGSLG